MTLREWLDKLKTFDPDGWGEIEQLRTTFSEEDLEKDVELEMTFATKAGAIDRVTIRLFDDDDQAVVDLDYEILQLDILPLTRFIEEPAFPPDEPNTP